MNYTVIKIESNNTALIIGNEIISIKRKHKNVLPSTSLFDVVVDKFIEIPRYSPRGIKFEKSLMMKANLPTNIPKDIVYSIDVSDYFPDGSIDIYCVGDEISVFAPMLIPII